MRIILLGNAGAGKSTMARQLIHGSAIPRLSLDEIAWNEGTERKSLDESIQELRRFLNPGVEVCVEHCRRRPWEPEKFSSPEAQQAMLEQLVQWVREYEIRDDEYGLRRHRRIFADFDGPKKEYTTALVASDDPAMSSGHIVIVAGAAS